MPLQPLFTTSPLDLPTYSSYQYPCTNSDLVSPLSTHNSHSSSPLPDAAPSEPRPTMSFPKLPIPLSPSSTESESDHPYQSGSRSPSLLTCLFTSRQTSISSAPLTPLSAGGLGARPILRSPSTSHSGTGSEDGHKFGLALTHHLEKISEIKRRSPTRDRKRLQFHVNSEPESNVVSPRSSQSRYSPRRLDMPEFLGIQTEEPEYESESDEGYQEDEEDGFTSDEEDGLFERPVFTYPWAKRRSSIQPRLRSVSPVQQSSDDAKRGRQVSIALPDANLRKPQCSRHLSPPPPCMRVDAPPAARSPSAAELCRRRGTLQGSPQVTGTEGGKVKLQGWKCSVERGRSILVNRSGSETLGLGLEMSTSPVEV